jgi:rod shape determining protein RodA
MTKQLARFDWIMSAAIFGLLVFGLLIIRSIAPRLFFQQLTYATIGVGLFFLFSLIDWRIYLKFSWFFYFGSLIFLMMTFLFGTITRGAIRWIQIGGLTIQPSELVKPFLILFFAWFFSESEELDIKKIFLGSLLLIVPAFLIFVQPDLGSTLVVILLWLGIILAAGISWRWLVSGFGFFVIVLPLIWKLLKDYQRQRIYTFFDPFADPLKSGYNIIQSIIAIGSGQLFGRGLGRGTQSHLRFLPERHSDFIFASLAEELGFMGTLILLSFFALLLWRILVIAQKTDNRFGLLVCLGIFTMIFGQIFINIGMNLGLLPITGITLPLVSSGGSSLVAVLISLGIIENIAGFVKKNEVKYLR